MIRSRKIKIKVIKIPNRSNVILISRVCDTLHIATKFRLNCWKYTNNNNNPLSFETHNNSAVDQYLLQRNASMDEMMNESIRPAL